MYSDARGFGPEIEINHYRMLAESYSKWGLYGMFAILGVTLLVYRYKYRDKRVLIAGIIISITFFVVMWIKAYEYLDILTRI